MAYKQVILIRADLKLPKGKMASQAAHASVDCVLKALKHSPDNVKEWRKEGMKKIALKVEDEKELLRYLQAAKDAGLIAALIEDAGHTIVEPGTRTCIGIGPDKEEEIDRLTGSLKMI